MALEEKPLGSDEDEAFIITVPEFSGSKTHSDTYEKAVQNGKEFIELCIEVEQKLGQPIPEPNKYAA